MEGLSKKKFLITIKKFIEYKIGIIIKKKTQEFILNK